MNKSLGDRLTVAKHDIIAIDSKQKLFVAHLKTRAFIYNNWQVNLYFSFNVRTILLSLSNCAVIQAVESKLIN